MSESWRQDSDINLCEDVERLRLPRDRVLMSLEESSYSEIIETIEKPRSQFGTVLAVGLPRLSESGTDLPHLVKAGDRVCIAAHVGVSIEYFGKPALFLREYEVLAVCEDETD